MADLKISQLGSIVTVVPATDVLPVVQGATTYKMTPNQILGSGGVATLASATVTGDLTVDTNTLKVDATNDNVIVGATSAIGGGRFSVQADLSAKQAICAKNSAASYSATNNFIRFTNSTDSTVGGITHPAVTSLGVWGVSDIQFLLSGAGTTSMTLNSTANLVLKGGTAAANGVGVTFPATQVASSDANCLDDYEEGTWVGTLKGSVSDPTVAVTATGKYTKVGRQVTVTIYYNNVSTVGASGNVTIDGLPFAGSESFAGSSITFGLFATSTTLACWNVSTSIAFYVTGNFVQATHSPGTGKYLTTTITYFV